MKRASLPRQRSREKEKAAGVETINDPNVTKVETMMLLKSHRRNGHSANSRCTFSKVKWEGIHVGGMLRTSPLGLNAVSPIYRRGITQRNAIPYMMTYGRIRLRVLHIVIVAPI
jgi:hypothetical protein